MILMDINHHHQLAHDGCMSLTLVIKCNTRMVAKENLAKPIIPWHTSSHLNLLHIKLGGDRLYLSNRFTRGRTRGFTHIIIMTHYHSLVCRYEFMRAQLRHDEASVRLRNNLPLFHPIVMCPLVANWTSTIMVSMVLSTGRSHAIHDNSLFPIINSPMCQLSLAILEMEHLHCSGHRSQTFQAPTRRLDMVCVVAS